MKIENKGDLVEAFSAKSAEIQSVTMCGAKFKGDVMNKSVKANIVAQAISAKFKDEYEKAVRDVVVAARKFAISTSTHNEFMALKLPVEMIHHVSAKTHWGLDSSISSKIDFITNTTAFRYDDPVYGFNGPSYLKAEHLPELAELYKLIKLIEKENDVLSAVIGSYSTAKKLIADLPWTEQYLPTASKCTGLIAAEVIADINAKFSK